MHASIQYKGEPLAELDINQEVALKFMEKGILNDKNLKENIKSVFLLKILDAGEKWDTSAMLLFMTRFYPLSSDEIMELMDVTITV